MTTSLPRLVACCVLFSAATAAPANHFLRISVTPTNGFPPGKQLTVIGQAVALPNTGIHPVELRLQDGRADANWNFIPASVHTIDLPFGSPNAANWSSANFPPFPAPQNSPTHRFKMAATILVWTTAGAPHRGTYEPLPGLGNHTEMLFQYKCLPVGQQVLCGWRSQ